MPATCQLPAQASGANLRGDTSEAMQGQNFLADVVGQLFPGARGLELLQALTSGSGLVPTIVDAAGTAAGPGGAAGVGPGVVADDVLGAVAGVLDV